MGSKQEISSTFDASKCRKYIFGGYVAAYMRKLQQENSEKFKRHFSFYIYKGLDANKLETLYKNVHSAIKKNPVVLSRKKNKKNPTYLQKSKKSYAERRD